MLHAGFAERIRTAGLLGHSQVLYHSATANMYRIRVRDSNPDSLPQEQPSYR